MEIIIESLLMTFFLFFVFELICYDPEFPLKTLTHVKAFIILLLISLFIGFLAYTNDTDKLNEYNLKKQYLIEKTQYYKTHKKVHDA
jgi:hypothetical protein